MGDNYEFTLKIISISLEVRFPCSLHLESDGKKLTDKVKLAKGFFSINQTIQIKSGNLKRFKNWEVFAVLQTDRGSKYNCGYICISYEKLYQFPITTGITFQLTKCSDKNAQMIFQVLEKHSPLNTCLMNDVSSASHGQNENVIEKLKFQTEFNQQRVASTGRFGDKAPLSLRNNSIAEQLDYQHMQQKSEDLNKVLFDKNSKIEQLESQISQLRVKLDKSEKNQGYLQREILNKSKLIAELEEKNSLLVEEIQGLESEVNNKEQQMKFENQNQIQHWKNERIEDQENMWEELELAQKRMAELEEDLRLQSEQNKILLNQAEYTQEVFDQKMLKQQQKVKQMQQKIESQQRNLQKLKKLQISHITLSQQKQSLSIKVTEMKKELQNFSNLKRSHLLVQEQLNIVKKNTEKTGKMKEMIFEKLSNEYKAQFQILNEQKQILKAELIKTLEENKNLKENYELLQINLEKLQLEKKNYLQQSVNYKKNLQNYENQQSKLSKQNNKLLEQNSKLTVINQSLTLQLEKQRKIKEQYYEKTEELEEKVNNLKSQLDICKFENEKYSLEMQFSSNQKQNNHITCKQIQKKMSERNQAQQLKIAELENVLIQVKSQYQEGERLMHQMRLEQAKNRQNISKMTQKLNIVEKKLAKAEQSVKQKTNTIAQLIEDRQKSMDIVKEYQQKLLTATQNYHKAMQQKHRIQSQQYQKSVQIKQFEIEAQNKIKKIEQIQEEVLSLHHKHKKQQEKTVLLQNEVNTLNREVERIKEKNLKLVSKLIEVKENSDPVEALLKYHRNTVNKIDSEITACSQELLRIKCELEDKNKQIQVLQEENTFLEDLSQKNKSQIEYLDELIDNKDSQLEHLNSDHTQLLSIHQEYIFSFNRYKIDKENEITKLVETQRQNKQGLEEIEKERNELEENIKQRQKQINMMKEQQIELEGKIKSLSNNLEKLKNINEENQQQINSQKSRNNKLTSELRAKIEQINDYEVQKGFLESKVESLSLQLSQNKNMLMEMVKSKEKIVMDEIQKGQEMINLETEFERIKIICEGLELDKESFENEIKELKNKNKGLLKQKKSLQLTITLMQESNDKTNVKIAEKDEKNRQIERQLNSKIEQMDQMKEKEKNRGIQYERRIRESEQSLIKSKQNIEILTLSMNDSIKQLEQKLKQENKQRNCLENQIEGMAEKISCLSEENRYIQAVLEEKNQQLEQMQRQYRVMAEQVKEKEQNLFQISGKMHEVEMRYESQERKTKMSIEIINENWMDKYDLIKNEMEDILAENQKIRYSMDFQIQSLREQIKAKNNTINSLNEELEDLQQTSTKRAKVFEEELMANLTKNHKTKIEQLQLTLKQKDEEIKNVKEITEMANMNCTNLRSEIKIIRSEIASLKEKIEELKQEKSLLQKSIKEKEKQEKRNAQKQEQNVWEINRQIKKQFYAVCKNLEEMENKQKVVQDLYQLQAKVMNVVNGRKQ